MFKRYRVSVWENEKLLEMDGGVGCTMVYLMYLMPLTVHIKFTIVNVNVIM